MHFFWLPPFMPPSAWHRAESGLADPHVRLEMTQLADTTLLHASQLPVTFGLLAFVFAGHAVFPGIYTSMREKERFPEMLDLTYLIVGATCLVVGVSGYLLYGEQVGAARPCRLPIAGSSRLYARATSGRR